MYSRIEARFEIIVHFTCFVIHVFKVFISVCSSPSPRISHTRNSKPIEWNFSWLKICFTNRSCFLRDGWSSSIIKCVCFSRYFKFGSIFWIKAAVCFRTWRYQISVKVCPEVSMGILFTKIKRSIIPMPNFTNNLVRNQVVFFFQFWKKAFVKLVPVLKWRNKK